MERGVGSWGVFRVTDYGYGYDYVFFKMGFAIGVVGEFTQLKLDRFIGHLFIYRVQYVLLL